MNLTPDRLAEVEGLDTSTRVFAAWRGSILLGALSVDERRGDVEIVFVQEFARRRGIGTQLLDYAREQTGLPLASSRNEHSEAGLAFAAANGITPADVRVVSEREGVAYGSRLAVAISMAAA